MTTKKEMVSSNGFRIVGNVSAFTESERRIKVENKQRREQERRLKKQNAEKKRDEEKNQPTAEYKGTAVPDWALKKLARNGRDYSKKTIASEVHKLAKGKPNRMHVISIPMGGQNKKY